MPVDQVVGGGLVLNTPDSWAQNYRPGIGDDWAKGNPHDSDAVLWNTVDDDGFREVQDFAHNGASDRSYVRVNYDKPVFQSTFEVRSSEVYDDLTQRTSTGDPEHTKYVRGINSLSENNPDRLGYTNGYRPGVFRWLVDNLRRPGPFTRQYELQVETQRDFFYPTNTPVADPALDTMFLNTLKNTVANYTTRPSLSRGAGNFDDSLMSSPPDTESGVIGGGF